MSLKDCIARDIDFVFMNTNDFCDNLVIQVGTTKFNVIGSLQSNLVQNNAGNGQPLQENAYTLYIKYPLTEDLERSILSSGARLTINNKPFSVVSVSDELGLATVILQGGRGR
jgi:hypothetical protein